jgi:hypothetical protein
VTRLAKRIEEDKDVRRSVQEILRNNNKSCSICGKLYYAKGLCLRHYRSKWQRNRLKKDPEYRAKRNKESSEYQMERRKNHEYRAKQNKLTREYQRERLKDLEYLAMLNKKSREYQREKWKDPEFRTNKAERRREKMKDPVHRAARATQLKERLRDPDVRAKYNARRRKWYRENAESERVRLRQYRTPRRVDQ